jgi:lysyl-tRNA synthetase, class II
MELDTNKIIELRRDKVTAAREAGENPFANGFVPTALVKKIHELYGEKTAEELDAVDTVYRLAGRVMAMRDFGNMAFLDLRQEGIKIQLVANKKIVGPELLKYIKKLDVGDIVGIEGKPIRTRTGELSIMIQSARLLTKSVRPLPEKWHGLTDIETRYRQRYVDLIMNPEVMKVFQARSAITRRIREFFDEHGFLEVETPMMHTLAGGATARPFETFHNALDMPLFLRVAPELYLKRLVVGGFDRVFEINRNFRNEGISIRHNPEFTMLEFYQAYAVYTDLMDLVEHLFENLAVMLFGEPKCTYGDVEVSLARPFARVTMEEAVLAKNPAIQKEQIRDRAVLADYAKKHGLEIQAGWGWGKILSEIFEATAEKTLEQPTFVYHYPVEISPLARRNDLDPEVTDRWELMIVGREFGNAFSELNDPFDQKARFEEQMKAKAAGDQEAQPFDADYIRALEYGLPPTAGCGLGIDRMVMLFMNQPSIRDVILFPHLRPE